MIKKLKNIYKIYYKKYQYMYNLIHTHIYIYNLFLYIE